MKLEFLLCSLLPIAFSLSSLAAESGKLNVVFILADDLGWGELGCYGQQKIPTPNIDRLAMQGTRFTQHYSGAPVCAPSRCVLMTGKHLGHAEVRGNQQARVKFPQFTEGQYPLSEQAVTIAQLFQKAGYATGAMGKWGLGPVGSTGDPNRKGFDLFFGYNCQAAAHSYYPPYVWRNAEKITINTKPIPRHAKQPEGEVKLEEWIGRTYAPKLMIAEAEKFIVDNAARPLFLYLPFIEPHVAMHPPRESVDKLPIEWDTEVYRGGNGYLPHPRPHAGYAAMINDLDSYVGRVLAALDRAGVADRTLVIFTSDNGTTHEGRAEPRFHIGGADPKFFNSTAGLRGFKGSVYEGGIRVPMIARLPGRIAAGAVNDTPSFFADWFPTLCDAVGFEKPGGLDGESLWPVLTGERHSLDSRKPMIWVFPEYGGQVAVRLADFKVVRQGLQTKTPGEWEVYDLSKDLAEANNLAATRRDLIQQVEELLRREVSENTVFPLPIPIPSPSLARPTDDPNRKFFEKYCQTCHAGTEPKGDFRIDSLSRDFADKENREKWLNVVEQLTTGTMPPKGKPLPAVDEAKALTSWIEGQVAAAETARNALQGRAVMRRLTQAEYQNTVRDLLSVDVELEDVLPDDTVAGGFDTSAETLHISSYQLDSYLAAAGRVLDAAVAGGPRPAQVKRRSDLRTESATRRHGVYRHLDDGVAIFSSDLASNIQIVFWNFLTRNRGKYRFRISATAYQSEKPVIFHVNGGTDDLGDPPYLIGYFDVPPGKPTVVEFVEQMEAGRNIRLLVDTEVRPRDLEREGGAANYQGPGLVVQWVEMEGPLGDSWPPPSYRLLFGDLPQAPAPDNPGRHEVVSQQPLADAEVILRKFTRRAFRRAVTDEDVKPFLDRVRVKLDEKYSFERALRVGLKAVLVSPNFLFLRESIRPADEWRSPGAPARPAALDEFSLASRLSYFLWSSMPDEDLLQLAEQGQLSRPETLREQVERMLRDPKAKAFTENFAGQWLGLRDIDATLPDRQLYPEYDEILRSSMIKEVYLFFDEVLKNDLSLTNFVSSDFSIINGRLADHYGIPEVEGLEFRKVSLPTNSHRGGVMTMAGIMKVTANGTTTSPIVRGAWVLDRLLGTPPSKPPADVEAVEPDIRGATTIRNQLAKHRQVAACAVCHVTIDPPGFALENFDVIGGWREHYRSIGNGEPVTVAGKRMRYKNGPPVDAGDVLPDGRRFRDIAEYKELLLSDRDQLARALAIKLLTYATGVPPTTADRPKVEAIVESVRSKDYGFRSLVHDVVKSEVFQNK